MILICDDDATVRTSLTLVLKRAGYAVEAASTPREVIGFVRQNCPELILMDMNYSNTTTGEEGLQLLAEVRVFRPEVPVILITAWGSIDLAVRGIKAGAFDFVTKPWNNLMLLHTIRTAIELSGQGQEIKKGSTAIIPQGRIIGRSPLLMQVLETVNRIAHTHASVLITGESGTGKELIAEAIHEASQRREKPFVKVNLGGISQSLFESEMFGHRQGAFTDARHDRVGRFEMAHKGTIFLDEIGELDLVCQVKLLRVLQDQTFEVLGDSRPRQVDTRIISATNRNLAEMVTRGTFREDLFYRVNLISIRVPALRERLDDLPLLVEHFVRQQARQNGIDEVEIAPDAYTFLRKLPFPGNIRELKNLVDRTILVSGKKRITEQDFKDQYVEIPVNPEREQYSVQSLERVERNMIRKAIELYGSNLSKIATALGVSRQTLYRRLEKYDIKLPE
ncbi:sigma-54 dependent transcriptional regulator [Parabacteroides sp. PF5-6]|uniref:sigma-54-dependent transcriptional regulator n=1 Tax=Parabacteroides sp. PF5-6 TaxID=1742403 RepID=UPI002404ECAA|nr:sigma-54 dependent transcriptional regulator [Parabacteroides sp. PF5-6]MDF9831446.1 two-component system NtrC family response regulator [Parabacteroides sp. PF5-6]